MTRRIRCTHGSPVAVFLFAVVGACAAAVAWIELHCCASCARER